MSTATGERLRLLHESRKLLYTLPCDQLFELPGRPNVVYMLKDYSKDPPQGATEARNEVSFLFKAFETGQIGPRRLARMAGEKPRASTIHEYLDWTVTAAEANQEGEYDFSGFRILLLYPRDRCLWPAPFMSQKEAARAHPVLGAPKNPWPALNVKGKPLTAATIRTGPGYLEVPFVATHEAKRGRGYGRCMVEAIDELARALGLQRVLLCSTCEEAVMNTWHHLGFTDSNKELLESWDVQDADLVHMQNTLQMHKLVPPPPRWRPLLVKHDAFIARTYIRLDGKATRSRGGAPDNQVAGAVSGYGFHAVPSGLLGSATGDSLGAGDVGAEIEEAMSAWHMPPNKQQQQQRAGTPQLSNGKADTPGLAAAVGSPQLPASPSPPAPGILPQPVVAPGTPVQSFPPGVVSPGRQTAEAAAPAADAHPSAAQDADVEMADVEMADAGQ